MDDKHLGMVVEEDGQVLIAFKPETIKFISDQLSIEGGDVVVIDSIDGDSDQTGIIITKLQ
jgi:hypothetical protein|tara:strand:- start:1785 stop:1967 length:183 start_codon:yes stop_codon:yes gene_type:complete